MEVNPIAVILVYMDSKGDRLLYRYPYQQQQQQQQQQHQQQQQSATQQKQYKTQSSQSQQTTIVEKLDNSSETIITTITTTTTNSISELKPNLVTNILKESIIRKRNPYAVTNTDDLLQTPPQTSNKICIKQGQLQGLEDRMLSTLLAVKQQLCHQKFELKINDVRFVSHPTLVPRKERNLLLTTTTTTTNSNNDADNDIDINTNSNNNNNINLDDNNDLTTIQTTTTTTTTINHKQPQQVLINVVFALHAQANYSIVKCYHKLSKKLGVVLRVEEQRIGYLSEETLQMARTHDEMSTQQQPLERIFDVISERSSLAQAMKTIYHDLCTTGVISLTLNQTKTLAFCMPQKAHQLHKKGSLVDPDAIRSCLRLLKPYHGMLLLVDFAELLDCVPPPGVRMLWQLIEVYTPLSSLQNMASDADIGIENVYKIVSHLVYWAKATIIYPLCETNVYVIAPDAALHTRSHLVEKFATRFAGMSLFEAIEDFSLPTSIGHLTTPLQQPARQGILVQMVLWMLQHHLLIQLHTYVQFMTCASDNGNGGLLHEHLCMELDNGVNGVNGEQHKNEQRNLLRPLSLLHLDDMADMSYTNRCHLDDDDNNINVSSSLLSMSSQPLPVPDHALRHSITETDTAYSADGSTVSDNIAAMPSSSHKSNYSMTASVSTENCESIDSIEDEEKIKELLQIFDESDAIAIRQIPASNNLDDLTLLVKLYQAGYFKSEHHLEEIMYFENLRRSQLLQLLDKFREVLIIYETEDPAIASMYNNK